MRVVESEVDGKKAVTRHIPEQTRHNGDVALVNAALTSHTAMLKVITADGVAGLHLTAAMSPTPDQRTTRLMLT